MKYLYLLLICSQLNFSYSLEGCKDDPKSQQSSIFYEHTPEVRDNNQFNKFPTSFYQLEVEHHGETDENGNIISFPTWKGIGICMMNEDGKFIPYNVSKLLYPHFSFLKVQEMQLNLDGTIRAQAIYLKSILHDQTKPSGEANWIENSYYQGGNKISFDQVIKEKSFQKIYFIQKNYQKQIQNIILQSTKKLLSK